MASTKDLLINEISKDHSTFEFCQNAARSSCQNQSETHQAFQALIKEPKTAQKSDIGVVTVAENGVIVKKKIEVNLDEADSIKQVQQFEVPNFQSEILEENRLLSLKNERYKQRLQKLNTLLKSNEDFIKMLQDEMLQVHNENRILSGQIRSANHSIFKENLGPNANGRSQQELPHFKVHCSQATEVQFSQQKFKPGGSTNPEKSQKGVLAVRDVCEDQKCSDILRALQMAEQLETEREVLREIEVQKIAAQNMNRKNSILSSLHYPEFAENLSDGSSLPSYLGGGSSKVSNF